jgi:hypothetical protein
VALKSPKKNGNHGGFRAFQGKNMENMMISHGILKGYPMEHHGIFMEIKQCMRDGNLLGYAMAFHGGYEIEYSWIFSWTKNHQQYQCR